MYGDKNSLSKTYKDIRQSRLWPSGRELRSKDAVSLDKQQEGTRSVIKSPPPW